MPASYLARLSAPAIPTMCQPAPRGLLLRTGFGAQSPAAYRLVGRLADGWFPQVPPGPKLDEARRMIEQAAAAVGRDAGGLGMEGRVTWHGSQEKLAAGIGQWRDAGASHVSIDTMGSGLASVDDHLAALVSASEVIKIFAS
jgi:hypothetical protein